MHYYKYALGTISVSAPTRRTKRTIRFISAALTILFTTVLFIQPFFAVSGVKVEAQTINNFAFPSMGVDELADPEYYPEAEISGVNIVYASDVEDIENPEDTETDESADTETVDQETLEDTTIEDNTTTDTDTDTDTDADSDADADADAQEETATGEEVEIENISETDSTISDIRTPAKIETLDKSYYGFSITVEDPADFDVITFRVKHENGEYSSEYIIEPSDLLYGDNETPMNIVTDSELYTFINGIIEIEFYYEGEKGFTVHTYEFEAFSNDPADELDELGIVKPDEYASTSSEVAYKELLFNRLGFNMVTREEWGAPTESPWSPTIADVTRIVVHHTATGVDLSNPKNTVKAIYDYHYYRCANNIGSYDPNNPDCNEISEIWGDIGYNYLIDPYGNVYEGRSGGNGVVGAHAIPNSGSIGISILGNYESQSPTQAALTSLSALISVLSQLNNITPGFKSTVFGHRDINATACPGAVLYSKMSSIVAVANQYNGQNSLLYSVDRKRDALITSRDYHEVDDQVELILDSSPLSSTLKEKILTKSRGVTSIRQIDNTVFYTVAQAITDQLIAETLMVSEATNIQPNFIYTLNTWDNTDPNRAIPSDYNTTTHWTHEVTNVPEVWKDLGGCASDNTCGGDQSIVVAVLDTGLAYENYNFDAGSSYSTEKISGLYMEIPGGAADGVYNEGYDREYTASDELNGVNIVDPKDTAQQLLCALRGLDGDGSNDCNAAELEKINHANDDYGHGTFVATIIAGDTSDAAPNRVVGISHNVSIMPVKVMLPNDKTMCQTPAGNLDLTCSYSDYDYRAVGTSYTIAQGIDHARTNGADIINMSLGGEGTDSVIKAAVDNAVNAGITVIVSSGNENDNIENYYPASYSNVIAVGAINSDDSRASYSNYGTELDIVAPVGQPGQSRIASQSYICFGYACSDETNPNLFKDFTSTSTPSVGSGTSYAAPQATAAAALALSTNSTLTPTDMYNLLAGTARSISGGFNQYTGYGSLDIENAIAHVNDIPDLPTGNADGFSVNTDSYADIIAYNPGTRYLDVTTSNGSNFGGGWRGYQVWNTDCGYDTANWDLLSPADVNGDGYVDIIAFNKGTTQVDVTLSTGSNFGGGWRGYQVWNYNTGYSTNEWRLLDPADINGDGMADLIAFNIYSNVIDVTLSQGSNFGGGYRGYQIWNYDSGYSVGEWSLLTPSDVNGDGMADIIAYNIYSTVIDVTLSQGSNFGGGYRGYQIWNYNSGYSSNEWRLLDPADINGDGMADIIAYNIYSTVIDATLSQGSNFGGGYRGYQIWNYNSGYSSNEWSLLAPSDANGDGMADIIAFNIINTMIDVTLSTGSNFGGGYRGYQIWNYSSGYSAGEWTLLN